MQIPTPGELQQRATRLLGSSLEGLEDAIARVREDLGANPKYSDKLGSHLAYLAKHVAQIATEVRRLFLAETKLADRLTDDEMLTLVLDWLEGRAPDTRALVASRLADLAAGDPPTESVL